MAITQRDRKRLDALSALIKPSTSLAAKLEMLSQHDQAIFEEWQIRCRAFMRRWPNGEAYRRYIAEEYTPFDLLPADIKVVLFGPPTTIPITANERECADLYARVKG